MLRTSDTFPSDLASKNVEVLVGVSATRTKPISRVADLSMKDGQPDRMADICGSEIGAILSATGWRYGTHSNSGIAVVMVNGQVAAASFIFGVIRCGDGCQGVNLSYFCAPQQEGKGYTKTAVAAAYLHMTRGLSPECTPAFVNVQTRKSNLGAIGLAKSFGFSPFKGGDFEINLSQGTVQFSGFTASHEDMLTHCERVLHHAQDVPGVADLFHSTAQLVPSDDEFQSTETPT